MFESVWLALTGGASAITEEGAWVGQLCGAREEEEHGCGGW